MVRSLTSVALAVAAFGLSALSAQTTNRSRPLMTLAGNTRPEARTGVDQGPVPDSYQLDHLVLQLKRPPEQQAALEQAVEQLHDPHSPAFHKWMTADRFGAQFGMADQELSSVRQWLESSGFHVNAVYPNRTTIDFSGNAGAVKTAFHTLIHRFSINGEAHIANIQDPQVPAALAPLMEGVVALHDFHPHALSAPFRTVTDFDTSNGYTDLGPGDLATIYNLNPLYATGLSGHGQTIVVLESSDIYSAGDWLAYRRVFGLAKRFGQGNLVSVHPSSAGMPCVDPGAASADREATLDAEVATAAAPNATVMVASCANTYDFGGFIAMRNLLNAPNPPSIMSISYGNSETVLGAAENAAVNQLFLQAAAEGVSVFVSAGDWGGDGVYSDRGTRSLYGLSVSGYASTRWNVAVGGTDFQDTFFGSTSDYWSPTNTGVLQSAISYIPEIPWNGSCASQLLATYNGFAHSFGADGFCNSPLVPPQRLTGLSGSGGPSSCAAGNPAVARLVGGTCAGRNKPSWQADLPGNPRDGVRDIPDVSLFASAGVWGHGYAICYSDPEKSGTPCTDYFGISGGTSASSPYMAGIQALVNQSTGESWGNPNPVYYALARDQFGTSGNSACNASLGNNSDTECTFHDVTEGDNDVICQPGSPSCYAPSGAYGVLSLSTSAYVPAYPAGTGWDFATGIGSVDGANLVSNWLRGVALIPTTQNQ